MKTLYLTKLVDTKEEASIRVPIMVLALAQNILPKQATTRLAACGVDISAIMEAAKTGTAYTGSTMITEKGVDKMLTLRLE